MTLTAPVLDHVVINVKDDLDGAAERYRALGFTLTPRGHHTLGSSNHLAMLGTDYIELLGFERGKPMTRPELVDHPLGLTGLVFKTTDADALAADLSERGLPVGAPLAFSRPVDLDGARRDAAFRTVHVPADRIANGRAFFCQHLTPDLVWRPEWQAHANGAVGVSRFVIRARDPVAAGGVYTDMFGAGLLHPVEGGLAFQAGDAEVSILTAEAVEAMLPGLTLANPADRMVALGLRVADLAETRAVVSAGAPDCVMREGRLIVPAAAAAGVALMFEV